MTDEHQDTQVAGNMALYVDYCVDRYKEEYERASRLETKASRYLSVVTLLFGALIASTSWGLIEIIPQSSVLRELAIAAVLALAVLLLLSWLALFRVLSVAGLDRLPLEEIRVCCKTKNLATVQWKIAETAGVARSHNIAAGDKKVRWLKRSYCLLHLAMGTSFLLFGILLYSSNVVDTTDRSAQMSESNDGERPDPRTSPSNEPDLTEPPAKPERIEEDAGRLDIRTKDANE